MGQWICELIHKTVSIVQYICMYFLNEILFDNLTFIYLKGPLLYNAPFIYFVVVFFIGMIII